LKELPSIIDVLIKNDFDTAIDQILLNVFPNLESMLKISSEEVQEKTIGIIKEICVKIGKKESSSSLNNIILSLMSNFESNQNIIF